MILTCDRTRGIPSRVTLPPILDELKAGGIKDEDTEIMIATGLHRGETSRDIRERLGDEITERITVKIHNSDKDVVNFGTLRSGTSLLLNKSVVSSELVILESIVEPHFFAGFTGGSKMIIPGVAGTETILQNHCWKNIDDPTSCYGTLQNPIREEADEALSRLKKPFAINLVLNARKEVVFATSGDPVDSFNQAAKIVNQHSRIRVNCQPDLIVTTNGGYPLDRNVYQCVKGIAVPEQVLHRGSRVVMTGECVDGVAHKGFFDLLTSGSPKEIYDKMKHCRTTKPDQWQVQVLCRVLLKASVWFVTRPELRSQIEGMHMHYASSVKEAIESAKLGNNEKVLVAPEGPSTILRI